MHAVVVSFVLAWTAVRALTVYSQIEAVRRPAILMLSLVIAQLCLGFTAFLTRVAWGRDAVQPELPMVISTVAHVAVGALLLATTVILAIQVWRHVPVAFEERVPQAQRDPRPREHAFDFRSCMTTIRRAVDSHCLLAADIRA